MADTDLSLSADELIQTGKQALAVEADALHLCRERLGSSFVEAVRILLRGGEGRRVVITGIGKSGQIGQKIAATFRSTGTPAVFLHAAEALHGDLGLFTAGDPVIAISKSGATDEILRLGPAIRDMGSPVIGILGNLQSPIAEWVDVALDGSVEREADPLGIAPTASAVVALALGDALAAALVEARGFTRGDFLRLHPSGQLGRKLSLRVHEVMHPANRVAVGQPETRVKEILLRMTERPLGAACVVREDGTLAGIFTDGDLRRGLEDNENLLSEPVGHVMTTEPVAAHPEMDLQTAADLMEQRRSQIAVLPVIEPATRQLLGLLRLHDIHQPALD